MNIQTLVVLAVVAVLIGAALKSIVRSRKNGGSCCGCSGNCAGCTACAGTQERKIDDNR